MKLAFHPDTTLKYTREKSLLLPWYSDFVMMSYVDNVLQCIVLFHSNSARKDSNNTCQTVISVNFLSVNKHVVETLLQYSISYFHVIANLFTT